jgi:hypothetical protein
MTAEEIFAFLPAHFIDVARNFVEMLSAIAS